MLNFSGYQIIEKLHESDNSQVYRGCRLASEQVVIQAELQHQHQLTQQEKTKIRLNNQGGGRQRHLSVTEEILLTLIYLRHSRSVSAGRCTIWGKRVKSPYDVPLLDSHTRESCCQPVYSNK